MPGSHLTFTLWQCHEDVGGCDGWLSSWWDFAPNGTYRQWWTGWHSPRAIAKWCWPGRKKHYWTLIGHERWHDLNGVQWKAEAWYAHPNPSFTSRGHDLTPLGHWVVTYDQQGNETNRRWTREILREGPIYLKGKGKGKGQNLSVCNHAIGL